MTKFLTAALAYAKMGWPIFPLWPGGKRPRIEGGRGLHDATTEEAIIHKWWTKYPTANIGLNCGAAGLVAIDIDFRIERGLDGYQAWEELKERYGISDNTYTNLTPTGGAHVIYKNLNGSKILNSAGKLGAGVDVKANGGYIILPPSIHPNGHPYAWEVANHPSETESLSLPRPLYELLIASGSKASSTPDVVGDKIPEGERDDTLISLAGTMRRRGMGYEEILAALQITNEKRCQPLLPIKDLERISKSACRYEPHREPRQPQPPPLWEETQKEKAAWKVFTLNDAYLPRPPLVYIIDELFTMPGLSIVYGPPGSFKSFILADAAMCVAKGKPWLEPNNRVEDKAISRPVIQNTVLWCDFDNGARRTHERTEALARAHDAPPDVPFLYVSMPTPWLDAGNTASLSMFTEHITSYGAKMVIVDNLGSVTGKADENSAEMVSILGGFRRVSETTGASIIIIHHQRKKTGYKARSGESLRGHSSIEAALDLALLIEREERSKRIKIRSTKVRGVDVYPFGAEFTYTHKEEGNELHTAQFYGTILDNESTVAKVERTISLFVRKTPGCTKGQLGSSVKKLHLDIGINRISAIIDRVESSGGISVRSGPNNAKRYYPS